MANFGLIVHFLDVALHISAQAYTFYFTYVFSGRSVVHTLFVCERDDSASPRQDSRSQEGQRCPCEITSPYRDSQEDKETSE